jgi:hypothetical protein
MIMTPQHLVAAQMRRNGKEHMSGGQHQGLHDDWWNYYEHSNDRADQYWPHHRDIMLPTKKGKEQAEQTQQQRRSALGQCMDANALQVLMAIAQAWWFASKQWQNVNPISSMGFRWHVDLAGPLPHSKRGSRYIMVCIEAFSKYLVAVPIPDKTPERLWLLLSCSMCCLDLLRLDRSSATMGLSSRREHFISCYLIA